MSTIGGKGQKTRPNDFKYDISINERAGYSLKNILAANSDIDTGSENLIAPQGGAMHIPSTAVALDFVSDNANDTNSSGTGARMLIVQGLDSSWVYQEEYIVLNGTTTVTTTSTWIGVNNMAVVSTGSGGTNEGTITMSETGSTEMGRIEPSKSTMTQGVVFVEAGFQFMLDYIFLNTIAPSNAVVTIKNYTYVSANGVLYDTIPTKIDTSNTNFITIDSDDPTIIPEKSVFYFTGQTDTNDTEVYLRFKGVLAPII